MDGKKRDRNLRLVPGSDKRTLSAGAELSNILTAQGLSQVSELDRLRFLFRLVRVCGWVD